MKTLGRANREGHPIYYFAADSVVALNEVGAEVADVGTVLQCDAKEGDRLLLIPIGIHAMAKRQGAAVGGGFPEPLVRIRQALPGESEFRKFGLIDQFLTEQFLRVVNEIRNYEYKLSVAIAELFFAFRTDEAPIDGIAYPSIATNRINANLAILPASFHRVFRPIACARVTIGERRPDYGYVVSCQKAKRIDDSGRIIW